LTSRPSLVIPIHHTSPQQERTQHDNFPQLQQYNTAQQHRRHSSLFFQRNSNSVEDANADDIIVNQDSHSFMSKWIQTIRERSDTMRSAGFYNVDKKHLPLEAGAKTNLTLFAIAMGYKWYRSIFINKMAIWERQPQWNTVITSKEQEEKANLEAMTCLECGSIIFIAKGRKWFQMPKGYKCYCCGAEGEENFENTRTELLEEIDDDYFDYEKPLDFVSSAERRKLMKEAGGDEAKAMELLTQGNMSENAGSDAGGEEAPKKKKKKKKGKKKKKKRMDEDGAVDAVDAVVEETAIEGQEDVTMEKKKKVRDELDMLDM